MNTVALKQRWAEALRALSPQRKNKKNAARSQAEAPPFGRMVAVLDGAWRRQRMISLALLLGLGGIVAHQQVVIWGLTAELRNQDYLVVPGAVDFARVRPNLVPDAAVVDFAEYLTDRLVSVTGRTMERRYTEMTKFMSPSLETRFQAELEEAAALLKSLQGAEVWSQQGQPRIRRIERNGQLVFEATLRGQVERYAAGRAIGSKQEVVVLTFRTSKLSGESPWLFEVIDFQRMTPEQHDKVVAAGGAK